MSGYDHIHSSPEIVQNGFKKAGIIEDGVEQVALVAGATLEPDKDPFDSDDMSGADVDLTFMYIVSDMVCLLMHSITYK